jgi:two-component system C4-dicarboxylate transport sensor histidine kinase DctB
MSQGDSSGAVDADLWRELGDRDLAQLGRLVDLGLQVAALVHELRQPLSLIRGYAQLLVERSASDTPARATAVRMVEQTERMENLLARTREYERGGSGTRSASCRVAEAVAGATAMLGYPERTPRLTVRTTLPSDLPAVAVDALTLQQILFNLLANARDALAGRDGAVEVAAGREDEAVRVWVEDDGPGIDPVVRERLFTPFVTGKPDGTGLGLWLCRHLAVRAGGSLTHVPLERGARFEVRLPCVGEGR